MATILNEKLITADEFRDMEFDAPVELVQGDVLEMTRPGLKHGILCGNAYYLLRAWADDTADGYLVAANDTGVITQRDPDTVRGPDVLVIRKDRLPEQNIPAGWLTVSPDVVVEVLSPSDQWPLMLDKVAEYLATGVLEVWVIEPEEKSIHIFGQESAPRILKSGDVLASEKILPGFSAPVEKLFEGV